MLQRAYLFCMWMSYIGASVSNPPTNPSSGDHQRISTAVLASSSTQYVVESNSHVAWDTFYWSGVSQPTTEILMNTEPWADSTSMTNYRQIRPTTSSEYLKRTGTKSEFSGVGSNQGGMDTLTVEIADVSTFFEREMLPRILTDYSVDEGSENGQTSVDHNVFWSNPNVASDVTSVNMVATSKDSHVNLSMNHPLAVRESFSASYSAFESIDSFSTFQDDHSFHPDSIVLEVTTLPASADSDIDASALESTDSFSKRSTNQRSRSDSIVLQVTTLPEIDGSDVFASAFESIDSFTPDDQSSRSDASVLDMTLLTTFDDDVIDASAYQSFDSVSTRPSDRKSRSYASTSTTLGYGNHVPLSQSNSDSTSGNATSMLRNTTSAAENTTSSSVTETQMCRCDCHYAANLKLYRNATAINITSDEVQKELKKQVTNLQKELTLNKTSLSSSKRKKTSMNDDRASARGVGLIGVAMLVILMGGLVLMDLTTIKRDFQRLRDNLGHCCKESKSAC
ncbi:hypothetical protein KP79_PYT00606 [Mizuhopecten yessoensis]|uniref:Uncharacterized protein n=1 Tax=Mizuhopecten yessoensis TaxID=6573 RepID=A0A210QUF0_MIZYE|nr:hypothetical protein KP79_PYT00606 [Mizuhopecten yessoensis]